MALLFLQVDIRKMFTEEIIDIKTVWTPKRQQANGRII